MSSMLKVIGWLTIISGIVLGLIIGEKIDPEGFQFSVAIYLILAGFISGIVFLALAKILDRQEETYNLLHAIYAKDSPQQASLGSSKASLSKMSGYQMKSSD